jgi:hypothetical protein
VSTGGGIPVANIFATFTTGEWRLVVGLSVGNIFATFATGDW